MHDKEKSGSESGVPMKNLFEAAVLEELKQRMAKLRPDSVRQWGKMNPAQALAHYSAQMEMVLRVAELASLADTERFERESGWRLVLGGAWMSSPRPGWVARGRMAGIPGEEVGL